MKPALTVAALAAALAAVATLARPRPPEVHARRTATAVGAGAPRRPGAPCPPDFLPDDGVCIPAGAPTAAFAHGAAIPKLPGRDAAFSAYVLPIAETALGDVTPAFATDGGAPGTGVSLRITRRTPLAVVGLAGQQGPARVVSSTNGVLVTSHAVSRGGRERVYLVVLAKVGAGRSPGETLAAGTPLGELEEGASLHLDVRRLLPNVDVAALSPDTIFSEAIATPEDPRNVLSPKR